MFDRDLVSLAFTVAEAFWRELLATQKHKPIEHPGITITPERDGIQVAIYWVYQERRQAFAQIIGSRDLLATNLSPDQIASEYAEEFLLQIQKALNPEPIASPE